MQLLSPTAADAPMLAVLHFLVFEESWSEDAFATLLAGHGVFALAIAVDARPAGLILMRVVADEAEVLTLAVAPSRQRLGLGRALIEAGIEQAATAGAATAFLEVAEDNAPALGLYTTMGFELAGRRSAYYPRRGGVSVDALILRKALRAADA